MNKLPNGWQIKKLKDISDITSSKRIYEWEYVDSGIPFYRGKEITALKNKQKIGNFIYISEERYNELKEKYGIPNKGDILITAVGTIGNAYTIEDDNPFYFKDGNLLWIKNIKEYPKFMEYLFENNKKLFLDNSFGSSQHALTISKLENLSFYFPPLDEQKRIASALSKIDAYLENTIKLIEEKEIFKNGIAKKLLNKEARFEGFNDEWKEYNLSKIGISYSGLRNKKAKSFSENCNAKYITYKSIYDKNKIDINRLGNVFVDKNENQNLVKYGDAFFTISSETPNEVAISSVLLDEVENTYLNSFCFGFRFDFNILLPEFARYYFRSDYIRKSTYKLAQGITRYNISKSKFLDIVIYLPSLEEQKAIGNFLSLLDAEIDNLKEQKEEIKKMKKGIINKLMAGEIRI